jgi:predicted flap endonuclease-1-like 5' DNA nuclease
MILVLDPLSKSVAISEMLLLLAFAAFIGWLIGRWLTNIKINALKEELAVVQEELNDCTNKKSVDFSGKVATAARIETEVTYDNLKLIEGIGPKIEILLNANKIFTFAHLADSRPEYLNELLSHGGRQFQMHNASTWPRQARLARDNKWNELAELQEKLDGGIE